MKTIFKRPLFVNPQAYTTIPELYSIDKLQSFNFDENDTYTTKLVYNGRVESIIKKAGKEYILHLDLYTVDGSCVLGEWYVKGIDSESVVTIDKNILTIVANNNLKYPGLIAAWSAKGKTNEDADRNVLKDLTGNGHDITLNNFAYSGMSGYGGYNIVRNNGWVAYSNHINYYDIYQFTSTKVYAKGLKNANSLLGIISLKNAIWESFKVKYTSNNPNIKCYYLYIDENDKIQKATLKEGINTIPKSYGRVGGTEISSIFTFGFISNPDFECTIERLPEYPDALVFDGVDDYGSDVDFGDITYVQTIIIKYSALKATQWNYYSYIRGIQSSGFFRIGHSAIDKEPFIRVAVIPNDFYIRKYTDNFIKATWDDNKYSPYSINGYANGKEIGKMVFYSAYLFDRSLDDQEIKSFIRKHIDPEYLLPSEIPAITLISNDTLIDNSTLIKNN